jgi:hypothetical protein
MRALSRETRDKGTLRAPDIGREASRPCNRNHRFANFLRDYQLWQLRNDHACVSNCQFGVQAWFFL